ncbi:MAG: alpha/beta hydrolase [Prolixibacteraceae bacterium]|nr:alpha/beta hydrolase [Prolixibacteraceae bacterium]
MKTPQLNIQGEGQPFIWLHGMLNSVESDSVYSLIDFESLQNLVSVVRYNYCNKSVYGDYSWPALTNELISVLDAQKYGKVLIGGLSMGAGTAIHAAVQFPERVKALILVTPPPAWEMREKVKIVYRKVITKTNSKTVPELLKRIIQLNQDPPEYFEQNHPGTRQQLLEHRLSFEPQYYTQIYLGGATSDFPSREQISEINVPTLIIAHPDDSNHPFETAQELNKLIKKSELVIISDYEDYKKSQIKIRHFLTEHGSNNKS